MTYTVEAVQWERGWELHIADVGVTQCSTLTKAPQQAAHYIETLRGGRVSVEDITVTVSNSPPECAVPD